MVLIVKNIIVQQGVVHIKNVSKKQAKLMYFYVFHYWWTLEEKF